VDWAIINKQNQPDAFNVFALFVDRNISPVNVEFQLTRGQTGEALEGYIQQWGIPETIHHDNDNDNAQEFLYGKFASLCKTHSIAEANPIRSILPKSESC
jgi:hypothetical protein